MTTREGGAIDIVDRLNREKKAWSFELVGHHVFEQEVVVLGRLTVEGVTKMAFGAAAVPRGQSTGAVSTALTSAANEALLRTARLFGMGLVLAGAAPACSSEPATDASVPSPENRITQKQLGAINGIARRRNLARAEVAEMLRARFGRTDLAQLTKREASDLLSHLSESSGHASL